VPVCVDASVLIRWLVPQQSDPQVYDLVDGWIEDGIELIGPALLFSEVISVLRHQAHRGTLDAADADRIVWLFLRLGIRRIDNFTLYRRAFELATHFGHTRAYDAHYLAAAEQEACDLWTADRPLYESVRRELRKVKHVSRQL
jgi:predicted nucleic acid-binding protein